MKKLINQAHFIPIIILVLLIPLAFASNTNKIYSDTSFMDKDFEHANNNYIEYCAGCHGNDLEEFVGRDWIYGKEPEAVFKTIKFGQGDIGMPDFKATFTDEEIKDLVDYILLMGKDVSGTETNEEHQVLKNEIIKSERIDLYVDTVVTGLDIPWGLEFLPNGDILISERSGILYRLTKNKVLVKIEGLPEIFAYGQGGLLDLELHPEYKENGWLYISYSYPAENVEVDGGSTAILRAKLEGNKLEVIEELYKAKPVARKGPHWGCRIEFDKEGYMYFSVGDRGHRPNAQKLDNHNGKIHRLFDDGKIPPDNPFVEIDGAVPSIYSYGHRNPQGVAMHPITGEIWVHEHGPKGGDEINLIQKGKNYGWPAITYGINYNGTIITEETQNENMEQPIFYYVPSIAPCGMTFVKGDKYPEWNNNILIGSLRFKYLERCVVVDHRVIHQERLLEGIGRVRNVEMSPDGYIYVAVETPGKILKLLPVRE